MTVLRSMSNIISARKDFQRTRIREKESLVQLVTKLIKAGAQLADS